MNHLKKFMMMLGSGNLELNSKQKLKIVDAMVLCVHSIILLEFALIGCIEMMIFNIGSIVTYIIALGFVEKEKLGTAYAITVFEISAHAVAAVYFLGLEFGFQLYVITLILLGFFIFYKEHSVVRGYVEAAISSVLSIAVYSLCNTLGQIEVESLSIRTLAAVDILYVQNVIVLYSTSVVLFVMFTVENSGYQKKLKAQREKLDKIASLDSLTGVNNRRNVKPLFEECFAGAVQVFFLFCDIDNFKRINDTFGHECGDLILKNAADTIKSCISEHDLLFRWGGEEFLIIISAPSMESAVEKAEEVRNEISIQKIEYREKRVRYTMTFGVSMYCVGDNIEEVIRTADENMYIGKSTGKNRVII